MGTFTVKDLVSILGLAGAAAAFTVGLYQYRVAQKWKKSEFAARLLEQLSKDPLLATCCRLLDWSARKIPVPEQYQALTEEAALLHDWDALIEAMAPEERKPTFGWQGVLYRDLFDHLFSYLERINHYITIRLITVDDVASLEYWLRQLADPRFVETPVFVDFLERYEYSGVFELMHKFNIEYRKE
jgi:hypothetical protein